MSSNSGHWFEGIADHAGAAYLRYSFTKGTVQEVDSLVEWLGLSEGMHVLDVGCGPGRHSHELARRGIRATGVDISQRFVDLGNQSAPDGARFLRLDARQMDFREEFDAAICLCQGAFGVMRRAAEDEAVLAGIARAVRPGGSVALSAFNAYFSVKYHDEATFDADRGVSHEVTEVRDENGTPKQFDLWTGCYTPRELRLLGEKCGLEVRHIFSVEPGRYVAAPPSVESPEYLLIASAPPNRRLGA